MSGGQAQRVALARALAPEPRLLLLDEPLAALDIGIRTELRRDLRAPSRVVRRRPRILVTHEPLDAVALADRIVVLEHGRVAQVGPIAEVAARPRSRYVAELVGVNLLRGHADGTETTLDDRRDRGHRRTPRSGDVYVAVHPHAVAVHRQRPEGSPRNVWSGRIHGTDLLGDRVRVHVDGEAPLVAEVTPAAVAELGLLEGHGGLHEREGDGAVGVPRLNAPALHILALAHPGYPCDHTGMPTDHCRTPSTPRRVTRARKLGLAPDDATRLGGLLTLLADPVRLRVLYALDLVDELCVGDIALATDATEDAVGYALRMLRTAGLVQNRKDGRVVFYRLADTLPRAAARALPARADAPEQAGGRDDHDHAHRHAARRPRARRPRPRGPRRGTTTAATVSTAATSSSSASASGGACCSPSRWSCSARCSPTCSATRCPPAPPGSRRSSARSSSSTAAGRS